MLAVRERDRGLESLLGGDRRPEDDLLVLGALQDMSRRRLTGATAVREEMEGALDRLTQERDAERHRRRRSEATSHELAGLVVREHSRRCEAEALAQSACTQLFALEDWRRELAHAGPLKRRRMLRALRRDV